MGENDCHPERKIFQISRKDTWLFGTYNKCAKKSRDGMQVFGTCCTKNFPQVVGTSNEIPANKKLAERKCSPAPTNHKCYFDGRRIVNGKEAPKNAYPFMVNAWTDRQNPFIFISNTQIPIILSWYIFDNPWSFNPWNA